MKLHISFVLQRVSTSTWTAYCSAYFQYQR